MGGDGYYYRNPGNPLPQGPCTRGELDKLRLRGIVGAETKVWKTVAGNIYNVEIGRRYTFDNVCSCIACGHMFELLMILFTFGATMFSMTLLDWHDDKQRGARYLLVFMTIITLVLVVFTVIKVSKRWRRSSTESFHSEV